MPPEEEEEGEGREENEEHEEDSKQARDGPGPATMPEFDAGTFHEALSQLGETKMKQ